MTDMKQSDEQPNGPEKVEREHGEVGDARETGAPVGPGAHQPADHVAPEELSARERELTAQLEDARDRLLRALAETENMRRRTERETEEARKYAITGFARELLDVADNLSRALASIPSDARDQGDLIRTLADGVAMTEKTLLGAFEKHQIKKIEPDVGEKFDHNRHQAMFEVATDRQRPGSVAQVMQPGYVIADRLLRPALVGVAKAPEAAPEEPTQESEASAGDDEGVIEIRRGPRANSSA